MKPNVGFSLIELVVAIAIIGIAATLAVPAFQSLVRSSRTESASNQLTSAILLARSEAIKQGRDILLCRRGATNDCASGADWSTGWVVRVATGTRVLRVWDPPQGNPTLNGPSTGLTFTARGDVTAGATFTLQLQHCSGQGRRTITVAPSGQNSLTRSDCV